MSQERRRNDTTAIVAERVKNYRLKAGLSVGELAKRADVTSRTIWRIEAGSQHDPRMSTVRKLATALEVEPGDLLLMTEEVA